MLARIRKSMDEKDEGFTLIELLVVMIIIGILAAIAIPVFLNQRQKAYDSGVKSDLRNAAEAEETYFVDNQAYMGTAALLGAIKVSSGDVLTVQTSATGYCIQGSNPNGTAAGGTGGNFYWYDSQNGGLQSGKPVAVSALTGVACTSAYSKTA